MKGMFLDFVGSATVEAAVHEYMALHSLADEWLWLPGSHRRLAELIEAGKGIPQKETLAYLCEQAASQGFPTHHDLLKPGEFFTEDPPAPEDRFELEAAPQFKSPAQRRWFFATHPTKGPTPKKEKGNGRWKAIMQAARDAVRAQPQMTSEELVAAVSNVVDPALTESEGNRVRELVSPERKQKLVAPPERVPREERTPETEELIEQEWARLQEERRVEKEKRKEREVPKKGPQNKPRRSPGEGMVPPLSPPGMPYVGAEKEGYLSKKDFFCKKYCDIADAAHWRAFVQAVPLVRGGEKDACIKETIENEYPGVDVAMVLKAAKDFVKRGANDPYIGGGTLAMRLIRKGSSDAFIASVYHNLRQGEVGQEYLEGFRACFSTQ